MARFSTILSSLEHTERKLVRVKLRTFARNSSINGQFLRNLQEERLVSESTWKDLFRAILDSPTDPQKLCEAIRATLRKHLFRGPTAKCPADTIFGRATTSESLARTFIVKHYFGSLPGALSHVRAMKTRELPALREKWRYFSLASFVMWSTFDPAGGRPFQGIKRSARFFRAIFGLSANDADSPLLLLEYILPEGIAARIPTVAEAYAGDEWLYHFRPASEIEIDEGYSRTYVWDELARKAGAGRPEVVHEPITGYVLTSDLEEVV
jgi:hypothetical protein